MYAKCRAPCFNPQQALKVVLTDADFFPSITLKAQILEFGLAVHEKFVPQDMRPLHKKLVDQFFVMKSSLGIQVCTQRVHQGAV